MTTSTSTHPPSAAVYFPYPELDRMHDQGSAPTYTSMQPSFRQLRANAIAVPTNLGDPRLGHLRLVVDAPAYINASNTNADFPNIPNVNFGRRTRVRQRECRCRTWGVNTINVSFVVVYLYSKGCGFLSLC